MRGCLAVWAHFVLRPSLAEILIKRLRQWAAIKKRFVCGHMAGQEGVSWEMEKLFLIFPSNAKRMIMHFKCGRNCEDFGQHLSGFRCLQMEAVWIGCNGRCQNQKAAFAFPFNFNLGPSAVLLECPFGKNVCVFDS